MTCGELREYLLAFLDNELDAPLSIEVQRHLDRCHDCAREVEIERAIRKGLERTVEGRTPLPTFDEQALADRLGETPPRGSTPQRRRYRLVIALSAAAAIALGTTLYLAVWRSGSRTQASAFSELLVADLTHFMEGGASAQIVSTDVDEVAYWLYEKTGILVVLPRPLPGVGRLVGGRKCKIDGRPAAFAVYDMDGVIASVVAVAAQPALLDGMNAVASPHGTYHTRRCGNHTVVALRRGDLVYAAVSKLPDETLLNLIMDTTHEGD